MDQMIYTIKEIAEIISPIAEKYGIPAVYLFGSYARGTATAESDVDLLIDTAGTGLDSLWKIGAVYADLEDAFGKKIDFVTLDSLDRGAGFFGDDCFKNEIMKEHVTIYEAA